MNAEGIALLRLLIFKMWSLNEARQNGNCQSIADEINTWMPPELKIDAALVDRALRGEEALVKVNVELLRDKIDKTPCLFSARLNGDYQAILNEIIKDPDLEQATLADVVEAMAVRPVPQPQIVVVGSVGLRR